MENNEKESGNINQNKSRKSIVSPKLVEAFERFVEYHPAQRLTRNLRSLLLEFLMYDGSSEAEYLKDLAVDLEGLFTLLDEIDEKYKSVGMA